MRLRALPARNQEICCSLKVCSSVMVCEVPLALVTTHLIGYQELAMGKKTRDGYGDTRCSDASWATHLAGGNIGHNQRDLVTLVADAVVVLGVREGQGQHACSVSNMHSGQLEGINNQTPLKSSGPCFLRLVS